MPDCDPSLMFTDSETGFLRDFARERGMTPPERFGGGARLVTRFGGCRDRRHDPGSGNQIRRRDRTRLSSAALGHRIGFPAGQSHAFRQ